MDKDDDIAIGVPILILIAVLIGIGVYNEIMTYTSTPTAANAVQEAADYAARAEDDLRAARDAEDGR